MQDGSERTMSGNQHDLIKTENPVPTLHGKGDIAAVMHTSGTRAHSMAGFADEFSDIVDYILKITHRIWEEKAVGLIYHYYLHNCTVHTSSGDIYGRKKIIEGTLQALAAFPDRRLYGDAVIWKHNPGDVYYSSHRIRHEGHNTGHTVYAPPTGRKVSYRAIADCVCKENRIIEEWLVRDELTLIRQLGLDPHELARRFAPFMPAHHTRDLLVAGEIERDAGQLPPPEMPPRATDRFDPEDFVRRALHEIWTWRLLNKIDAYFAPNLVCESASERHVYGTGAYKAYILSLMSPFPDIALTVDHFCAVQTDAHSYDTATRWTMQGTHTGPGIYGEPTGKRIQIIGVSHHRIVEGRITHEWTLFDEFALLKQLYAPA
jgi:predicted ester cyclase